MGWVRKLFHFWQKPAKGPAWINPQFLGIAVFLFCIGTVSITLALLSHGPPAPRLDEPAAQREYVGFSLDECLQGCDPARALAQWETDHQDSRIVKKEPVQEAGILLGYWITYEEDDA